MEVTVVCVTGGTVSVYSQNASFDGGGHHSPSRCLSCLSNLWSPAEFTGKYYLIMTCHMVLRSDKIRHTLFLHISYKKWITFAGEGAHLAHYIRHCIPVNIKWLFTVIKIYLVMIYCFKAWHAFSSCNDCWILIGTKRPVVWHYVHACNVIVTAIYGVSEFCITLYHALYKNCIKVT